MQPSKKFCILVALAVLLLGFSFLLPGNAAFAQVVDNPNPPDQVVKLIFIHHSTGENWLRDDYGGLGAALAENNYFVSDTNYGWGPDSIGDRTDIPDWLEWFRSAGTPTYLDAIFNESGQNSSYTRLPDDPGGENQVILFKSCFPNSALEGSPDDPPSADGWLTVGHAKYVYNEILQTFATRPDKLFIVITAPPLQDGTYAGNARAFNQWLMNDWLAENNYTLPNVAVFDFYNVLTGPDNHHRFADGQIEHVFDPGRDTSHYPSSRDDDHPSERGSRKATEEFIPLLNIFYHRWAEGQTSQPQVATQLPTVDSQSDGAGVPLPPETVLSIDDFETGPKGWAAFRDEATSTTVTCGIEQGTGSNDSASLRIDFSIVPGSWATCALFFDTSQDWSPGEWLAFDIRSNATGQPFSVIVYGGTPDNRATYIQNRETYGEYAWGFIQFNSRWNELLRADWEENAGSPFGQPGQVTGLAFGFDAGADTPYAGSVWIDNVHLEKSPTYPKSDNPQKKGLPCLGSILLPLLVMGAAWVLRRK